MKGKIVNWFVANTPFQILVINMIITEYFNDAMQFDNYIISTVRDKEIEDDLNIKIINMSSFGKALLCKKILTNIGKTKTSFFIPHLNNFFSELLFSISLRKNIEINVYYEGTALYYDPIVNLKKMTILKRKILGILLNHRYRYYRQLFPPEFVNRVKICYAPKNINLEKYKEVKLIHFDIQATKQSDNILLLTSNDITNQNLKKLVSIACLYKKEQNENQIIYIKPHYEFSTIKIEMLYNDLKDNGFSKIIVLKKNIPIESLYSSISFETVLCQQFTSAIINMNLIFGNKIHIKIMDNNFPQQFLTTLKINL